MTVRAVYVVLLREHGLFLAEPTEGEGQRTTMERVLGLKGGYSGGLVELDLPEGAEEYWVAWVELEGPGDRPLFEYRALDGRLTEAEAQARLHAAGEEPLKMNRSPLYSAANPRPVPIPEEEPEAREFTG